MAVRSSMQAETVAIPKRLQLVTQPDNRNGVFDKDSQLINCYAERDPTDGEYWIAKRPGFGNQLTSVPTVGIPVGRGLYKFSTSSISFGFLAVNRGELSIAASSLAGAFIGIGSVGGTSGNYVFETIRSSPAVVVLNDGANAYYTNGVGVTNFNTVANFPTSIVKGWAYLDGTLYVMDTLSVIHGSNIDDVTTWSALNVIIARDGPDWAVALAKHKSYVVALKTNSTEFFYNASNPFGSPLLPLRGSKIAFGCANADSVSEIDSELFWISVNDGGGYKVIRLTDLRPRVISTPAVERLIRARIGGISAGLMVSFGLKVAGHRFYCVTFDLVSSPITLVYDLDQNTWYRWTSADGTTAWPVNAVVGPDISGRIALQRLDTGNVHEVDGDFVYPTDAGVVSTVDIYTPNHDFGTQRIKNLGAMFFRGNRVIGSLLKLRWSDDDYETWSNFSTVDLSHKRPELMDCGSFYNRAWNLRHQSATPFRIKTFDLQIDVGQL